MRFLKLALVTLLVATGTQAGASSTTSSGYVSGIYSLDGGIILFIHSGTRSATPGCATTPGRWAINASTAAGQARLAALLTAYALHKPINVSGNNTCDVWGDTETVASFQVAD